MTTRGHIGWALGAILVGITMALPGKAVAGVYAIEPCLGTGTKVIGAFPGCWFLGDPGQSCTEVCTSNGLVYDENTRTVAGSDGTMDACMTLQGILGVLTGGCVPGACTDGFGCSYDTATKNPLYCTSPPTTADAANVDIERVCACMQRTPAPALSHNGLTLAGLLLLSGGVWLVRRRVMY